MSEPIDNYPEIPQPVLMPDRLYRWAWLPVPLFVVAITVLWVADYPAPFESIPLLTACNFLFSTLTSLYIAYILGRSFRSDPSYRILLMGSGVLVWGVGSIVATLAGNGNINDTITIHNLCLWVASCFHFAAVALPSPRKAPSRSWALLCAFYLIAAGVVLIAALAAKSGLTPIFFVKGAGGTLVRQFTLVSTISLLTITVTLLRPATGYYSSPAAYWYACGLALLAAGLFGVMIQSQGGSLLSWFGRSSQYLGGIYLVAAAYALTRKSHETFASTTSQQQRYLVAVALVFTAMAVRMVFLKELANTLPYLTFYPAITVAALYGGLNPGLVATVLSALIADYFIIEPGGIMIWKTVDIVSMSYFLLSSALISGVTETMHRFRLRAQEADTLARLADERESARKAISESEERFRILADSSFEGIAITEAGRLTDVNDQFVAMFGYPKEELLGMKVSHLLPPEDRERVVGGILRGAPLHIEHGAVRKDGTQILVEAHGRNTTYRGRSVRITLMRDITERKKMERKLQRERDLLQAVMDGAKNSHLVYVDNDFNFVQVNDTYARSCGYSAEEMIGKNHFHLYPDDEVKAIFVRARDTGEPFEAHDKPFEFPDQPSRGMTYWDWTLHPIKESSGKVIGLVFSLIETTERKKAEEALRKARNDLEFKVEERTGELARTVASLQNEFGERKKLEHQLLQSQKMESIGLLAGGVAHDFNNMLSVICGYGEIIREQLGDDDEEMLENVDHVLHAASRAAELTKSLLTFGRKQPNFPRPVLVNDIIANTSRLIQRLIGENIEFVTELHGKELAIMADSGQIAQVLMNLATNARDAMPGGGRLTITVRETRVNEGETAQLDLQTPGEYAQITVDDNGTGIGQESLERIFEPFFTTKGPGKGTGLGLSIVYGIVKQHNGSVLIESTRETGTTVNIYLPLIPVQSVAEDEKPGIPPAGGSETLLVAEDEEIVRTLLTSILEKAGFRVIAAGNGVEALEKFRENDDISLVVTDVVMPKLNGREILEEIRKTRPDMKGIYISGYTADIMKKKGILEKETDVITKPIRKDELLRKIREVLDNG